MGKITIGKIVPVHKDKPINLPGEFQAQLRPEKDKSNLLMILEIPTKNICIKHLNSEEALEVNIGIGDLSPYFLQELGVVFMRNKLKTIYSTGLAFTHDACVYTGYIDSSDLTISQEQLEDELTKIRGVSKVDLKMLYA